MSGEFTLRPMRDTDKPFIVDSWITSDRNSARGREAGLSYITGQKRTIAQILGRHDTTALVACLPDDDDAIVGWAVFSSDCVYYAYVRKDARRMGLARKMLASVKGERVEYTHKPVVAGMQTPDGWRYNPYRNHHYDAPKRAA